MFGIGLPELILILGIALIVVGPEKLPELAKSLAKGIHELKKTATALKESVDQEMKEEPADPWRQNLEKNPALPGVNPPDASVPPLKESSAVIDLPPAEPAAKEPEAPQP